MPIHFVKGDATEPIGPDDVKMIIHICNDIDKFGKGFVAALSKKWPETKRSFHAMKAGDINILGNVGFCWIDNVCVANMISQHGIYKIYNRKSKRSIPPIRYDALHECLQKVRDQIDILISDGKSVSIHMPRIGCGLAGGKWELIEPIINDILPKLLDIYVYDLWFTSSKVGLKNDPTIIGPVRDIKLIIDVDIPEDTYRNVTHGGELLENIDEKYPANPPGTQYL